MRFNGAVEICENDLDVAAVVPKNLAAGSAGRREFVDVGNHGDPAECPFSDSAGQRGEQGRAFGTAGKAEGR